MFDLASPAVIDKKCDDLKAAIQRERDWYIFRIITLEMKVDKLTKELKSIKGLKDERN